jgi:hypothetical protein
MHGSNEPARLRGSRCPFPNGVWTILVALALLFIANCFSLTGLLDCRLVTVEADLEAIFANATAVIHNDTVALTSANSTERKLNAAGRRGVGLMGWEGADGKCVCAFHDAKVRDLQAGFCHVTGAAWKDARSQVIGTVAISWPIFLWLLSFTCYAYRTLYRNILGLIMIVIMTSAQNLQWTLKDSDFCRAHDCDWGQSLWTYMAATPLFIIAGIVLILSTSEEYLQRKVVTQDPLSEICTLDEEERRRDGFNNAREVPVEGDLIDPTLINPTLINPTLINHSPQPTLTALREEP